MPSGSSHAAAAASGAALADIASAGPLDYIVVKRTSELLMLVQATNVDYDP